MQVLIHRAANAWSPQVRRSFLTAILLRGVPARRY